MMTKLWAFFSSFDKLMKEKLVKAFYWLALTTIVLRFAGNAFHKIGMGWLDNNILDFVEFFTLFLTLIVGFRLIAEIAIAVFRINDNLSPDGGKSETANIDPLEEARRAAEAAAIRARQVTKQTFEKTSEATKQTFDRASDATKSTFEKTPFHHDDNDIREPRPNPARTPQVTSKGTAKKASTTTYVKAAPEKATPKKTAATSKTRAKKAPTVKKTTKPKPSAPKKKAPTRKTKSGLVKYNKDGSVKKKPGPKVGSSSRYTKDGRLKKKPGPKPK